MPAKDRILAIVRSRHYASSVYNAQTLTELLTPWRRSPTC